VAAFNTCFDKLPAISSYSFSVTVQKEILSLLLTMPSGKHLCVCWNCCSCELPFQDI